MTESRDRQALRALVNAGHCINSSAMYDATCALATPDPAAALEDALRLAVDAMRAPLDDWKGVVERKALDAARAALAAYEAGQS